MKIIVAVRGEAIAVDDQDYENLSQYRWYAVRSTRTNIYALTFPKGGDRLSISMHSMLVPVSDGMVVDHINGCGLDNQRHNLRPATHQQNSVNRRGSGKIITDGNPTTEYIGVCKRAEGKYFAYVNSGKRQHTIGVFATAEQAAIARDKVALHFHGLDARLNFPNSNLQAATPAAVRKELDASTYRKNHGSGHRGVSKVWGKWRAGIKDSDGRRVYLGSYTDEKEAALAVDAALLYLGQPRENLNFPDEPTKAKSPHDIRERPLAAWGACGYLGVRRKRHRFSAHVMRNRKLYNLGVFDTPEEAARAYDAKAIELGETLNLNFPQIGMVQ
jgi:hypothetical protein